MNCPGCQSQLETINYEKVEIETCRNCGGEWLDHTELKKIVDRREVQFEPEKRKALAESINPTFLTVDDVTRNLRCPKCSETTKAINYGGDSGIIIDRCIGCKGIWLDAGELEKIQMFVEGISELLPADLERFGSQLDAAGNSVLNDTSIPEDPTDRNARYTVGLGSVIDFTEIFE